MKESIVLTTYFFLFLHSTDYILPTFLPTTDYFLPTTYYYLPTIQMLSELPFVLLLLPLH